jgi:hypothetical protein
MSNRQAGPQQHPNLGIGSYAPGNDPITAPQFRPDFTRHTGLGLNRSDGPGAWDTFAAGCKGGLADFVSRLHGERAPEPEKAVERDDDKGLDR